MDKDKSNKEIRVRMAPSPTGSLHVGTARTALFNYLFAKHYKGKFIVRIEDTDKERSEKKWEEDILKGFEWLGLEWDEFYRQSEREDVYEKYIQKLLESGKAFYCWHAKEELQKEREKQMQAKMAPKHVCDYRDKKLSQKDIPDNSIVRFRNDVKESIVFTDLVRNEVKFNAPDFGDFSIAKSTKEPLYNLAVVIDDHEMKISHILRGEDHISNTPRQILILEALGFQRPKYAHIPLLLGGDKSKLSKRHGATSVYEYKEQGYLPEAMFNFLALLGWRPKEDEKEIMEKNEIIQEFDIADIQKSGAVFDVEKLSWMNSLYIRKLSKEELTELCVPYLEKEGFFVRQKNTLKITANGEERSYDWLKKVITLEHERIKKLSDITEGLEFIFKEPKYESELLIWKKSDRQGAIKELKELSVIIQNIEKSDWTKEDIENIIMPHAESSGLPAAPGSPAQVGDRGQVLWPLRAALSGKKASPGPFEILEVLGKEEALKRINTAINKL
ncbi:MAG: glutamate--tRNA ligase [Candidatus Spechtbacterales bacterium]